MRQLVTLLLVLLTSLFVSTSVFASGDGIIVVVRPFDNVSCLVNSTNYSAALDLNGYKPYDFTYALQLTVTNTDVTNVGVVAVSYELSNNNIDYVPNDVSGTALNIVTNLSFTNSPMTGGKGFYQFDAGKSRYIRFKAIVTGTNCWLSGWLAIQ